MGGKTRTSSVKDNRRSFATIVSIGIVVSVVLYFALIAVYAAIVLKSGAMTSYFMPIGITMGLISAYAGGFVSVRPLKEKGLLWGAITGFVSSLLCSVFIFILNDNKAGKGIFILMIAMIVSGALGGLTAVNLKIRKKY